MEAEGIICVCIDLSGISKDSDPEKWYAGLVNKWAKSCPLPESFDYKIWLKDNKKDFHPADLFHEFIETILFLIIVQYSVSFLIEITITANELLKTFDF